MTVLAVVALLGCAGAGARWVWATPGRPDHLTHPRDLPGVWVKAAASRSLALTVGCAALAVIASPVTRWVWVPSLLFALAALAGHAALWVGGPHRRVPALAVAAGWVAVAAYLTVRTLPGTPQGTDGAPGSTGGSPLGVLALGAGAAHLWWLGRHRRAMRDRADQDRVGRIHAAQGVRPRTGRVTR